MNIYHRPIFDTDKVCKLYSEKDGVPVQYVCTTSPTVSGAQAADIFYRDTPHPEFGNSYFGLFRSVPIDPNDKSQLMITNADKVEDLNFDMLEINGKLHYSQHRHDFHTVGDVSLDGGRAYLRIVGNMSYPTRRLMIQDGQFVEKNVDKRSESV